MSRRLRTVLLIGCLGLCALGAPGVGSLLAQGPDGALGHSRTTPEPVSARADTQANPAMHGGPERAALLATARIVGR